MNLPNAVYEIIIPLTPEKATANISNGKYKNSKKNFL